MKRGSDACAENLSPAVIGRLSKEVQKLHSSPPDGVQYVQMEGEEESLAEIHCEIAGPVGTPYEGGHFLCKLVLDNQYPTHPPRGFFLTSIFHPNVSSRGDICVNTLKRDWGPQVTLSHITQVIRCLLIQPFAESALNDEAGKLFMESYDEYHRRAAVWTKVHACRRISSTSSSSGEHSGKAATASPAAAAAVAAAAMPSSADDKLSKKRAAESKAAGKRKSLKRL